MVSLLNILLSTREEFVRVCMCLHTSKVVGIEKICMKFINE
jgi:hypothetical protein